MTHSRLVRLDTSETVAIPIVGPSDVILVVAVFEAELGPFLAELYRGNEVSQLLDHLLHVFEHICEIDLLEEQV
jgi:23S rRNA U2552 (ribose-2'-O)-methylase RlmE/FtsJ